MGDHESEDTRLEDLRVMEGRIGHFLEDTVPQVWIGDFNTLTREDYNEEQWEQITNIRREAKWELPRTEFSNLLLNKRGLIDSWASVGRPGQVSTCRFSTHIDYILYNQSFQDRWICTSVQHHPSTASDHQP